MEYTICMYILQVVPLIRLPRQMSHTLTYYSSEEVLPGSLIIVEVRNTDITAIVCFCQELTKTKQDLKKFIDFKPKPIQKSLSDFPLLTEYQLTFAQWLSTYYAHPLGNIIKWFLPKLSNKIKRYPKILNTAHTNPHPGNGYIPKIFLENFKNRILHYKKIIQHNSGQLLILVPDTISLQILTQELAEYQPTIIHSQLTTKEQRSLWSEIKSGARTCIIGTRSSLFLPFHHLSHIIIEDEPAEAYYSTDTKPQYHSSYIAIQLAKLYQTSITLGSHIPSIFSLSVLEEAGLSLPAELYPEPQTKKTELIAMQTEFYKGNKDLLSIPVQHAMKKSLDKGQSVIIYVNRRGESLYVSCKDCGYHLRDPANGTLLSVHRTDSLHKKIPNYHDSHILMSHTSKRWFKMIHKCPQCKSPNLHQGGIGIEKIYELSKSLFPHIPHFMLSSDSTTTIDEQQEIIHSFTNSSPGILLTTRMIHKFLDIIPPTLTIIPSAESLVNFPDYTIREKSIQVLSELIEHSHKTIIQSFTPWNHDEEEPSHIYTIITHPIADLWIQEYAQRKHYKYPPHYEIIAIHSQHSVRAKAIAQALRMQEILTKNSISALGPIEKYIARGKGAYRFTITIQTTPHKAAAIKRKLVPILENGQDIEINPQSLF